MNFLNDAYAFYLWLYRQRSLILAILLNEMWKISCKIIVVALFVYDWGEFINISLGLLKNGNSIKNYQLDVRDTNLGQFFKIISNKLYWKSLIFTYIFCRKKWQEQPNYHIKMNQVRKSQTEFIYYIQDIVILVWHTIHIRSTLFSKHLITASLRFSYV